MGSEKSSGEARHWWLTPLSPTGEAEIRRIAFKGSKKFARAHLNHLLGVVAHTGCPKIHERLRSGGLWFKASLGRK
jgi:hypothetical protein